MRIDIKSLETVRSDKVLKLQLALVLNKSYRTIERYLAMNSFPDKLDGKIQSFLDELKNRKKHGKN